MQMPAYDLALSVLFDRFSDGDQHGWKTELAYLREHHSDRLAALREDVVKNGIKEPIVIGPDGRVWDGHHRICIADELGMTAIPVRVAI